MNIHLVNFTKKGLSAIEVSLAHMNTVLSQSDNFEEAFHDIKNSKPQVVIINWGKEDFPVTALCKKIKRQKNLKYMHLILLAPREKQKKIPEAFNAGADDFLYRPFGKEEFALRLGIAARTAKLEDRVSKARKKLIKFAKEDPVSGLLNRRSLFDETLKEMERASRKKIHLSVMLIGIHGYGKFVDEHGAENGDAILQEMGRRIKNTCRPYDKSGRYGISEFLVCLPDSGIENAEKAAKRILSSIEKSPFELKEENVDMKISIGMSELGPEDFELDHKTGDHVFSDLLLDSLVRRAKLAMNKAFENGESSIEI